MTNEDQKSISIKETMPSDVMECSENDCKWKLKKTVTLS